MSHYSSPKLSAMCSEMLNVGARRTASLLPQLLGALRGGRLLVLPGTFFAGT